MKIPREPRKAKKAVEYLTELRVITEFYMLNIPKTIKDKFQYIEDVLIELSIDDKIKAANLAKKIREEINEQLP